MNEYEIKVRITARDAEHAAEIVNELVQRACDALDSGDLDDGEVDYDCELLQVIA